MRNSYSIIEMEKTNPKAQKLVEIIRIKCSLSKRNKSQVFTK